MGVLQQTKFQHNPSSRFWDTYEKGGTSARANVRRCRCIPPMTCVICIATWSLNTYRSVAQCLQSFPRYEKGAHLHVLTCRCTVPMTCVICIATWSLNAHQIWSLSAEVFLSYSLAANFDIPHAARATCKGDPTPKWAKSGCKQLLLNRATPLWRPRVNRTHSLVDIGFSKASVGQPAGSSY